MGTLMYKVSFWKLNCLPFYIKKMWMKWKIEASIDLKGIMKKWRERTEARVSQPHSRPRRCTPTHHIDHTMANQSSSSSFFSTLQTRSQSINSLLCVGLDPHRDELPEGSWEAGEEKRCEAAFEFCRRIVDATGA